jgi:hypothetical protein
MSQKCITLLNSWIFKILSNESSNMDSFIVSKVFRFLQLFKWINIIIKTNLARLINIEMKQQVHYLSCRNIDIQEVVIWAGD